jgi:uncharacterized protein YraI
MKKTLLAGIAALSVFYASAAQATDAVLPTADPLIGEWCPATSGIWTSTDGYVRRIGSPRDDAEPRKRGTCHASEVLRVRRDGYDGHEWGCDFSEVKRLSSKDGYSVGAECGGEGFYWNEKAELRIVDKMLRYQNVVSTERVPEDQTSCAVVSSDIPDEGLLNLRTGPGTQFSVKTKLQSGNELKVDAVSKDGDWKRVTVTRFSNEQVGNYGGWVRGKFINEFTCKSDTQSSSALPIIPPDQLPTIGNPNPVSKWVPVTPEEYRPTPTEPPKTANANPINLPSAMIGSWCYNEGAEARQVYIRNDGICIGIEGVLTIWPDGYRGSGGTCTFTKIEKLATNVYLVKSSCKGLPKGSYDGLAWAENVELQINNGQLKVTSVPET